MALSRRALIASAGAAAAGGLTAASLVGDAHASPLTAPTTGAGNGLPAGGAGTAAAPLPVASRNSVFSRRGAGPRYWSIYGWSFPHNAPIPEDEWKANVDWLAAEFAPYGYTMPCTDGWIEASSRTNDNGYIVTYNDGWQHDWAWWAEYIRGKGMDLGVYYNPLWVHRAAVADTSKTVIGRPDVRIADIVTDGDFFAGGIGGDTLYWADVTKDGAKEYIQGYVRYFRDLGVPYLRIDFLSWYENGQDANIGTVGLGHGRAQYETALRWIHEAAGDDMQVSLVMPHLFDHGAAEIRYGDLIRINADADRGGWDRLSGGRQSWQNGWSQWHNPFAGFTGFADRSGRGQFILDGDFLMMNTFANDDERRTCVSLMTIAGSPLTISDLHSNIGAHAWAYQNEEVLALNDQGLVGKPYFHSAEPYSTNPGSRDTERWAGQLPDGSWAVALFNRGDTAATRTLDLAGALGLTDRAAVRDLWEHRDLGRMSSLTTELPAHGVRLVKVSAPGHKRVYQAAFAAWGGGAGFGNTRPGHTAMGYADLPGTGASVTFGVEAARTGTYRVRYRYAADADATLTVGAEELNRTPVGRPRQVALPATGGAWATAEDAVRLTRGTNILTLISTEADTGAVSLNSVELR
ncbi:hypothetical protein [Streptomyces sp. NBC_01803]|uniref:hypothetical protein n=1 Tax=Streptomyces sp. NBC_01803 TaxID=2975946 RepID=UPI002DDC7874|nr:hypothetical protein [Streptomyces sp. NBC_01803]WSA46347.1 hypothetical protein OIE51_20460 [Streptomyces sp. NBC_01803]